MFSFLLPPLIETLRVHFALSKTRIETLAVLLVGLANGRTVNLSHLASQFPGGAMHASNYRRLQRFFQFERLDADMSVRLIVRMLKLDGPKLLALDRTNWKLGQGDVNILVLAVVTRRFRVPLIWTLLEHGGASDTGQRIALMERYLRLFGASSIEALLADREFIGTEWMKFLNKNSIPFAIRLKENMQIRLEDGSSRQFRTLLRKRRRGAWAGWLSGMQASPANRLRFAAKRIKDGELLVVATNLDDGGRGLNLYRKRWGIECLFADAKTRGLNIEDTHITASSPPCWSSSHSPSHGPTAAQHAPWAERPSRGRPMAGARNPGSASASTHCETGSSTSQNAPFRHGPKHAREYP